MSDSSLRSPPPYYTTSLAGHAMRLPSTSPTLTTSTLTRAPVRADASIALLTGLVLRESLFALAGTQGELVDINACAEMGFGAVATRGAVTAAAVVVDTTTTSTTTTSTQQQTTYDDNSNSDAFASIRSHTEHASCALLALASLEAGDGAGSAPIEASLLTALSITRVIVERNKLEGKMSRDAAINTSISGDVRGGCGGQKPVFLPGAREAVAQFSGRRGGAITIFPSIAVEAAVSITTPTPPTTMTSTQKLDALRTTSDAGITLRRILHHGARTITVAGDDSGPLPPIDRIHAWPNAPPLLSRGIELSSVLSSPSTTPGTTPAAASRSRYSESPRADFITAALLGAPVKTGKWYSEVNVLTGGEMLQVGWASTFGTDWLPQRGHGVGDDSASWSWCVKRHLAFHVPPPPTSPATKKGGGGGGRPHTSVFCRRMESCRATKWRE
jgi:hypothetical protein